MTRLPPSPAAGAPRTGSPFVVRVTGLPVSALTGLSSAPLRELLARTLAAERAAADEGRALADEMGTLVGELDDPSLKPVLVGLRRSLFRGRPPRGSEWTPAVRAALPAGTVRRIGDWTGRLARRDRLAADLPGTLDREVERTLHVLLDTAARPEFRHGLAQSSPTLSAQWEKWLAHRDGRPARRVVVRLARYVSRAAAKTSPDSTFTSIGTGVWTTGGTSALALAPLPAARCLIELHGTLMAELAAAVCADDRLRPALRVRANPSLTRVGDRVMVLGRRPLEDIASLTALPGVDAVLAALDGERPTLGELCARLGAVAQAGRVRTFVDRLAELAVIEPHLPVDDQERDKFGVLARWLRQQGGARWAPAAAAAERLSAVLSPPGDPADVAGHRARLRTVAAAVADLRASAGLPPDPDGRSASVHEYAVLPAPVATAALPAWQDPLAGLDLIRRWMAPHDPALPLRLALGAYWNTRRATGVPVPFLVFHRALLAELARTGGPDDPLLDDLRALLAFGRAPVPWRSPALRDLAALRARSVDALLATRPGADGVARPDPALLAESAACLPNWAVPAGSVAWFVQPDGPRLVLNSAMGGHGRGRDRAFYLIAHGGGKLPATGPAPDPPDHPALVADSCGEFGHSLNLRRADGGHELDYPFTVHSPGGRPVTALRDLAVEQDPATGLLRLRHLRSGRQVVPAHRGMVVETGLPPALQLLCRGLGASPGWLLRPDDLLAPPAGDTVTAAPRIEVGTVVLRRATWTVPAATIPRRGSGEPPASHLLRLHRWLAEHRVPERCFVRTSTPGGAGWAAPGAAKARKPLYVDFASPWLVALFEKLTAGATDPVAFTEALPSIADGADDRHVAEAVVETAVVAR